MKKTTSQATSLLKALRVLMALEDYPEGRGVTDLARSLGLPKSAVHRLLTTFQERGFVQQLPQGSQYRLGATLARLGLRTADMLTPRRVARPVLEALAEEVGETIFLGVLQGGCLFIADKVEYGQVLRISPALGTVLPLRQTALGQVWLAYCSSAQRQALLAELVPDDFVASPERWFARVEQELTIIRQQGYAVNMETWLPELCCLAAPVQDSSGELVAALAIALPRSRMPQPQRHDPFTRGAPTTLYPTLVPALRRAVEQITAALP